MANDVLFHPYAQVLAWALVHFLWQGAAIGLITVGLLRVRRFRASTRYTIGIVALASMLAAPIATSAVLLARSSTTVVFFPSTRPVGAAAEHAVATRLQPRTTAQVAGADASLSRATASRPSWSVMWLLWCWAAGVALLSMRLLSSWLAVRRLVRQAVRPVNPEIRMLVRRMAGRLALDRIVRVCESSAVVVPVVVGWLKPVMLLPASTICGLAPAQIEAIIAHELAHVRRHDYLINVLQAVVETLLFYHPAVWWVSTQVRAEREHCCDDLAVGVCDRLAYVTALADLATMNATPRVALAASGGSLVGRVRRLLGGEPNEPLPDARALSILVVLLVVGTLVPLGFLSARARAEAATPPIRLAFSPSVARLAVRPLQRPGTRALLQGSILKVVPLERFTAGQGAPLTPDERRRIDEELDRLKQETPRAVLSQTPASPRPSTASAAGVHTSDQATGEGSGQWIQNDNGSKVAIKWTGAFRLADDDRDIAWIESGKTVEVTDGGWLVSTGVLLRGSPDGTVQRTYHRNGFERPYEPEGREFLANALLRAVRTSAFAAESRVARFLKQGGPDAVFAEIAHLQGDYARRVYYTELLKQTTLSSAQLIHLASQASATISSDYELGVLLKQASRQAETDDVRLALIDATKAIRSDYEQRQALMALMPAQLSPAVASAVLKQANNVRSDFERATLLIDVVHRGGLSSATQQQFFELVRTMSGSYEQGRVLKTALAASDVPADVISEARRAAAVIGSDYDRRQVLQSSMAGSTVSPKDAAGIIEATSGMRSEDDKTSVLVEVAKKGGVTDTTAASFFSIVGSMSSSYQQHQAIAAVLAGGSRLNDTVLSALLKAAGTIKSPHDRAETLIAVARHQSLSPATRPLYVAAAEGIQSDYDQTRALAELVRAEKIGR